MDSNLSDSGKINSVTTPNVTCSEGPAECAVKDEPTSINSLQADCHLSAEQGCYFCCFSPFTYAFDLDTYALSTTTSLILCPFGILVVML